MMALRDIALVVACAVAIVLYEVVVRVLVVTTPLDGPIVSMALLAGPVMILDTFLKVADSAGDARD